MKGGAIGQEREAGLNLEVDSSMRRLSKIGKVILVGSGKGGVGKSVVACGLALSLSSAGHRTGILDVDVHGASVPSYLGVHPPVRSSIRGLEPKRAGRGLGVMSLSLFTGENPVPLRGEKKQSLITQLFSLTDWGPLDFLVVDLPPSTGDELFSALSLFGGKAGLILVTTPSRSAIEIVARLRRLAKTEGVQVKGVVVNMAYLRQGKTGSRMYPFGKATPMLVRRRLGAPLLAELPLEPTVSTEGLMRVMASENGISRALSGLAALMAA